MIISRDLQSNRFITGDEIYEFIGMPGTVYMSSNYGFDHLQYYTVLRRREDTHQRYHWVSILTHLGTSISFSAWSFAITEIDLRRQMTNFSRYYLRIT